MSYLKAFVSAILAGISIGFGGLVFLSVDNKVIGAALFTIGLFCICTFGFNLFTGKVCYAMQNSKDYAMKLPVIWFGKSCRNRTDCSVCFTDKKCSCLV